MRRFSYSFETQVVFDSPVSQHHFLLRSLPNFCRFQTILSETFFVEGVESLRYAFDAFGNRLQYGFILSPKERFAIMASGTLDQRPYRIIEENNPVFFQPTALTKPAPEARAFLDSLALDPALPPLEKALSIARAVHARIAYTPGYTSTYTTAAEVLASGKGVCQDYAHLSIALCRLAGISARYVNGLMAGEGASHAWIEVYANGMWRGIDPTNEQLIDYGYIKFSHGRDFSDCPINRGVMSGATGQTVEVRASVRELVP